MEMMGLWPHTIAAIDSFYIIACEVRLHETDRSLALL